MKLRDALSLAMKTFIDEHKNRVVKNSRGLLDLKGIIKTKKRVVFSEEIDNGLYTK